METSTQTTPPVALDRLVLPSEIWLQWHGDSDPSDDSPVSEPDVTWSRDRVFDTDIRYILAPMHECKWKTFRRPGTYDEVWGSWDAVQECECGKRRFGKSDEHGNFQQNDKRLASGPDDSENKQ